MRTNERMYRVSFLALAESLKMGKPVAGFELDSGTRVYVWVRWDQRSGDFYIGTEHGIGVQLPSADWQAIPGAPGYEAKTYWDDHWGEVHVRRVDDVRNDVRNDVQ